MNPEIATLIRAAVILADAHGAQLSAYRMTWVHGESLQLDEIDMRLDPPGTSSVTLIPGQGERSGTITREPGEEPSAFAQRLSSALALSVVGLPASKNTVIGITGDLDSGLRWGVVAT